MPTAVEFHFGSYASNVLGIRQITPALVEKAVSRGGGMAIGDGKTLFKDDWECAPGDHRSVYVVTHGGNVVTSWIERG